jgi:hypothetical protein
MSKAKNNKITQIYPREEFEVNYKTFEEDQTLENYLNLLFECQNSAELNRTNEISLEVTDAFYNINRANEGLDKLREIWDALNIYSSKFKYLGWPEFEKSKIEPAKATKAVITSPLNDFAYQYGELLSEHFAEQSKAKESMKSLGIKYLPTQATYSFLEHIPSLKIDLGFDIFGELDEYLAGVDKSLPKSTKKPIKIVKDRSLLAQVIATQWHYLMELFWNEWKKALPEIQKCIRKEDDDTLLDVLRTFGKYIYTSNLFAGFLIIYGVNHGELDRFTNKKFRKENSENVDTKENDISIEKIIDSEINELQNYGLNENTSKTFAAFHAYLIMYSIDFLEEDSFYEKLDKVLHFSSFLTPNIRSELVSYVGDCGELFTSLDSSGLFHAAFSYRTELEFKHLTDVDGIRKIEALFECLDLQQYPLSDDAFISASDALIYSSTNESASWGWRGHWKAEDLFFTSQQIFNKNLFKSIYSYENIPDRIKSLESLQHFSFLDYIPNEPKLTCPIWALAKITADDDSSMYYLQSRTEMYLNTIDCMLEYGLISGAAHLFFFYLVTESVIVVNRLKERKESAQAYPDTPSLQGFTAPFGDWNRINTIFLAISQYGFENKSEKAARFVSSLFAESKYDELNLAKIEIDRFARSQINKPSFDSSAQVIQLVTGDNSTLRSRMLELLGKDKWESLKPEIQSRILMLERNHDVMNGDEVIYGESNNAWFPPYVTLLESLLKSKIGELWEAGLYHGDISQCYIDATQHQLPNNKFTLGIALQVLKGAVKSGNKSILEFCKKVGVDIFRIASELSDPLLKVPIRHRNSVMHGSTVTKGELELARTMVLKLLPVLLVTLGENKKLV